MNSIITFEGSSVNGGHGHIAYVEAVEPNGDIWISHSGGGWSWYGLQKLSRNKNGKYNCGAVSQGFIYLTSEEEEKAYIASNGSSGGSTSSANGSSYITQLVNGRNKISFGEGNPELKSVSGGASDDKMYPEAATAYESMKTAAEKDGIKIWICSTYRTYADQNSKFVRNRNEISRNDLNIISYYQSPLTSEHRTGLAVDFGSVVQGQTGKWDTWLAKSDHLKMYNWLYDNGAEYGFILRYPPDCETKTGINPESWHFRYVGKEIAKKFKEKAINYEINKGNYKYSTYTYEEFHEEYFKSGNYGEYYW